MFGGLSSMSGNGQMNSLLPDRERASRTMVVRGRRQNPGIDCR